jgi:hypothetical protein
MQRITIFQVLIAAFLIRLLWLMLIPIVPVSDSAMYNEFAQSLISGNGYAYADGRLTAYWPVGTSALYAAIYTILPNNFLSIGVFNLIVGTLVVFLSWKVCRFYFDQTVAKLTAILMALWPLLVQSTTVLGSELIFIFMLLLSFLVWNLTSLNNVIRGLIFGLLIGLTCYIRPTVLPLIFILPILSIIRTKSFRSNLVVIPISLLMVVIITSPWSYRNTELNNQFTFLSTNFGPNLWMGNNENSVGAYMLPPNEGFSTEKERDDFLRGEAIEFIRNNPGKYFELMWKRAVVTFSRETIGVHWNQVGVEKRFGNNAITYMKYVSSLFWLTIFFLAVLGALFHLWKNPAKNIFSEPLIVSAFFAVIPILTVGQDRYHMAIIPFVAFYAASILNVLCKRYKSWLKVIHSNEIIP